jgi:hypothetical protein
VGGRAALLLIVTGCLFVTACRFEHAVVALQGSPDASFDGSGGASGDAAAPLCDPTDQRLRACYTFEGNTLDQSAFGHDITAASGTVFVAGDHGLSLATTAGTYTVASSATLDVTALTIKVWIKPNRLPTGGARMGLVDSASRWRLFVASDGALRCSLTGGIDFTTVVGRVAVGTWQRVACTFDGVLMRIFVDGVMVGQKTQASTFPAPGSGMVVGHNNPTGDNFDGLIDDVQLFNAIVEP